MRLKNSALDTINHLLDDGQHEFDQLTHERIDEQSDQNQNKHAKQNNQNILNSFPECKVMNAFDGHDNQYNRPP